MDVQLLMYEDKRVTRVYQLDMPMKEACYPNEQQVPWPITWLAARYSRKHILLPKGLPDVDLIGKAARKFGDKLKWRWHFRHDEGA